MCVCVCVCTKNVYLVYLKLIVCENLTKCTAGNASDGQIPQSYYVCVKFGFVKNMSVIYWEGIHVV